LLNCYNISKALTLLVFHNADFVVIQQNQHFVNYMVCMKYQSVKSNSCSHSGFALSDGLEDVRIIIAHGACNVSLCHFLFNGV